MRSDPGSPGREQTEGEVSGPRFLCPQKSAWGLNSPRHELLLGRGVGCVGPARLAPGETGVLDMRPEATGSRGIPGAFSEARG